MIGKVGDPVLRKKCKPVTEITPNILQLLDDMADTLAAASNGAALAAPQVGILRRMVVIDSGEGFIELINPEIIEKSKEQIGPEGCLSLPGIWGRVKRAKYVKVKAVNRDGEEFIIEGRGFMARCLQHEIDHLDGTLFIDYVAPGQLFQEHTDEPVDVYRLLKASRENQD
ncbi:peptide deformylase [Desulforamulus ruminis]|uniref:Peptide deformylase n=1 Tax=Desulforamulus ruminis (strain ATCC 23193 / DSM 2154 / NCIMB 8452 / DL) TaxID=696281 RepID=F6DUJ1_DESRL|nr:peptide deformylase [Desulforamulus ruminis DSM 2154]